MNNHNLPRIQDGFSTSLLTGSGQEFFFPVGVPGFASYQRFVLSRYRPANRTASPFFLLRAKEGDLAFPLVSPHILLTDYRLSPSPAMLTQLGADTVSELIILAIVTLRERILETTANLQGPLLFNPFTHLAQQFVAEHYPARYPLFEQDSFGRHALFLPYSADRC
jgi:flagellar assembly factor FliW